MHPELERLIDLALADGKITDKELEVLYKKAHELAVDMDEFEMVVQGKLHLAQESADTSTRSTPKGGIQAALAVNEQTMEYLVRPFIPIHTTGTALESAASQLSELINSHMTDGWHYVRLESVTTFIPGNNGCFGYGATPATTVVSQVVVFQR